MVHKQLGVARFRGTIVFSMFTEVALRERLEPEGAHPDRPIFAVKRLREVSTYVVQVFTYYMVSR